MPDWAADSGAAAHGNTDDAFVALQIAGAFGRDDGIFSVLSLLSVRVAWLLAGEPPAGEYWADRRAARRAWTSKVVMVVVAAWAENSLPAHSGHDMRIQRAAMIHRPGKNLPTWPA
ncbi:hypothetical protein AFERRI_400353 [Acidithiobacillus ferrivorans]|uniref:Uncharacterized protein n=2 Tax=Acidithiobacillus ferrivorans TaxID=160808 RepID=A0A060UPP1_9PROT|nr:hypothetical protein AFERRI_400353 [Acidithiobacillus ferrivorans]